MLLWTTIVYGFLIGSISVSNGQVTFTVDSLESHIQTAFSVSRPEGSQGETNAKNYINTQFQNLANDDDVVLVLNPGNDGNSLALEIRGSRWGTATDKFLLITATYGNTSDTSPGVNSNGSGMSALLEIAKALVRAKKDCTFQNSVIIAAIQGSAESNRNFVEDYLLNSVALNFSINLADTFQGALVLDAIMNYQANESTQTVPNEFGQLWPGILDEIRRDNFKGNFLTGVSRIPEKPLLDELYGEWINVAKQAGNAGSSDVYDFKPLRLPMSNSPTAFLQSAPGLAGYILKFQDFLVGPHTYMWEYDGETRETGQNGIKAILITDTKSLRSGMTGCLNMACDNSANFLEPDNLKFLMRTTGVLTRTALLLGTELKSEKLAADLNCKAIVSGANPTYMQSHLLLLTLFIIFLICGNNQYYNHK